MSPTNVWVKEREIYVESMIDIDPRNLELYTLTFKNFIIVFEPNKRVVHFCDISKPTGGYTLPFTFPLDSSKLQNLALTFKLNLAVFTSSESDKVFLVDLDKLTCKTPPTPTEAALKTLNVSTEVYESGSPNLSTVHPKDINCNE